MAISSGAEPRILPMVRKPSSIGRGPRRCDGIRRSAGASTLVEPHYVGFGQRVEMQLEPDHCRRGVLDDRELVSADREHREQIAVRMIAWRWSGPAIARRAKV